MIGIILYDAQFQGIDKILEVAFDELKLRIAPLKLVIVNAQFGIGGEESQHDDMYRA